MVNRVGPTFVHEVKERTGMTAADVASAYVITREVFRMRALWSGIESLDNRVTAQLQYRSLADCGRLTERGTVWFLGAERRPLDIGAQIKAYAASVQELAEGLDALLSEADRNLLAEQTAELAGGAVPRDLARRLASLPWLAPLLDIVRIARGANVPLDQAGRTYFAIGARFGFDWLRRVAAKLPTDKAWTKLAVSAIMDDLSGEQAELTARVLASARKGVSAEAALDSWVAERGLQVARVEQFLTELQAAGTSDLAMLAVANRALKAMGA